MQKLKSRANKFIKAFTLIELLVSVAIFAFMTSLMVAKYGNFNQSVLLTNLAYDVAVTIRTAQSYGLSVKSSGGENADSDNFRTGYGVYFDTLSNDDQFILYADRGTIEGIYDGADEVLETYNLKRGAIIEWVCDVTDSPCNAYNHKFSLDISFKRPDPSANIYFRNDSVNSYPYAKITIKGTDGNTRDVIVRENGQISVSE